MAVWCMASASAALLPEWSGCLNVSMLAKGTVDHTTASAAVAVVAAAAADLTMSLWRCCLLACLRQQCKHF
jgi:hypothetical protein